MKPRVSIVMPTYNRADTLVRAIDSVLAQTFEDWELILVDDGSTDETAALLTGLDPRVRVIRQENRGVAGARNRALAEARGDLLAFADSDDVVSRHHLELAAAFFAAHPDEHLYSSELWEDFGRGIITRHFWIEAAEWYPETAKKIGARAFAAPPKDDDGYLRIYTTRSEVGAWGRAAVERSGHASVYHYRGDIFERWRWGWLMALQPTVITRAALGAVGPFDERIRVANDFAWLAELCRRFPANYLSIPGAVKHEQGALGRALREGHLATGKTAVTFQEDVLEIYDALFTRRLPDDPEIAALRGFRQYLVAQAAARQGDRDKARACIHASKHAYRGWDARELGWLLDAAPTPGLARAAYQISALPLRLRAKLSRLAKGLA